MTASRNMVTFGKLVFKTSSHLLLPKIDSWPIESVYCMMWDIPNQSKMINAKVGTLWCEATCISPAYFRQVSRNWVKEESLQHGEKDKVLGAEISMFLGSEWPLDDSPLVALI
jgi:hypothetical protein